MRVAALYDIHGNLPSLEAVLADVERTAPGLIVVGGDVASGPLPAETIDRLRGLADRARFVRGNGDRTLVHVFDGGRAEEGPAGLADEWCASRLTRVQRDFLASFEPTVTADVDGLGPTLFCHASPRADDDLFTAVTPPERVRPLLAGVEEAVVVCGHTHMQFDRVVDGIRLVNAGSVGMAYGLPGAYWTLLGPDVGQRRVEYDLELAAARIRKSSWPGAEEFARENVLAPPSEAEAIAAFEQLAADRESS